MPSQVEYTITIPKIRYDCILRFSLDKNPLTAVITRFTIGDKRGNYSYNHNFWQSVQIPTIARYNASQLFNGVGGIFYGQQRS